jgi:hypothetical protein
MISFRLIAYKEVVLLFFESLTIYGCVELYKRKKMTSSRLLTFDKRVLERNYEKEGEKARQRMGSFFFNTILFDVILSPVNSKRFHLIYILRKLLYEFISNIVTFEKEKKSRISFMYFFFALI